MVELRADNRLPLEIRPIEIELDTNSAADGSATFSIGLTTVQVSVHGPRESLHSNAGSTMSDEAIIYVSVALPGFVPGQGIRRKTKNDRRTTEMATAIKNTFQPIIQTTLFPRSEIAIYVNILSSDGALLPAAINCTLLALIHAGINISSPLASISLSALHDTPLVDPSQSEESDLPTLTVACIPPSAHQDPDSDTEMDDQSEDLGKVTLVSMETRLAISRFEEMLKLGMKACHLISKEMDAVIRAYSTGLLKKVSRTPMVVENQNDA